MYKLQVVTVSTREGRQGHAVAKWFSEYARFHNQFEVEDVDLAKVNLPLFDEPNHPRLQQYVHDHTRAWSKIVQRADAFVFVTPEYDYGAPPSLINALVYLTHEWFYKPVGFVSYGGVSGGTRGVQMAKLTMTSLKLVPLPEAVSIPFFTQFIDKESGLFQPDTVQLQASKMMLDELLRWTGALHSLRAPAPAEAPAKV
jgi:NAD(P)H-dependent FMN reductase